MSKLHQRETNFHHPVRDGAADSQDQIRPHLRQQNVRGQKVDGWIEERSE